MAIAWGLDLPEAYWMPIAVLAAIKPTLEQTTLRAEQRLAGALIGASVAALLLLTVDDLHALQVVVIVALALSATIYTVNYALYAAAMATSVLIAIDLPDPANHAAEVERVVYTFVGVAIGALITLLANLLAKHAAKAQPPAGPQPA